MGAGAGYNIPVSVSAATTQTSNPVLSAPTNFAFSSPWASTGTNDQSARNTEAATATSAAAQGNLAQQATSDTAGANAPVGATGILTTLTSSKWLPWIIAGSAVLAFVYFKYRKHI